MIIAHNPTFLAILETHVPYARILNFWMNNNYISVHIVEANGHSGGIRLLKNSTATTIASAIDSNQYSVTF